MMPECPICNMAYSLRDRTPMVLPCGHGLCKACIEGYRKQECPICRDPYERCSKNFAVLNMLEKPRQRLCDYAGLFKICVVGESGVGKSSILNAFEGGDFDQHIVTTIGLGFKYINQQVKGKMYKFELWDTGGQEKFRALTRTHYKNSDLIMVVYSMDDISSLFEIVRYWLPQVVQESPLSKILLIGNKLDRIWQVTDELINKVQQSYNLQEIKVSCKDGTNIEHAWRMIVRQLIKVKQEQLRVEESQGPDLHRSARLSKQGSLSRRREEESVCGC